METCPECNGKKKLKIQVSEYWEEIQRFEEYDCIECEGNGEVHRLQLAVYKARGGSAVQAFT